PGSGPDVISFNVTGVITLSNTLPNVEGDLTVSGPGPGAAALTISGGDAIRVFVVASTGRLTLNLLTLSNGSAASFGGCIYSEGMLVVNDSVITTCKTPAGYNGGGIMNANGTLWLMNSIVENNQADFAGGIDSFGTLVIDNSIVRYNRSRL